MSPGRLLLQNFICLIILGFGEYGNHIRVAAKCKPPNPDGRSRLSVVKSSYAVNEVVEVLCIPGYRPLVKEITCKRVVFVFRWSSTPQCIAQCKKPLPAGRFSLSVEKDYYDVNEVVIVQCNQRYRPREMRITCRWPETGDQWDPAPQCVVEQCKKPENTGNYTLSGSGNFYDVGQSVTVQCSTGHRPLYKRIRCVAPGSRSEWDNDPLCIAQCKKPHPDGRYSLSIEKEYYDVDEVVTVQCNEGYETLVKEIRCRRQGSEAQWDRTPWCTAQCKMPENTGNYTLSGSGKFYHVGESVTVRCRTGYRPLYERIRCVAPGSRSEWDPKPLCIERCKKPSISNLQKISPSWEYYNLYDEVTLQCEPGYYPSSDTIRCTNNGVRDDWSPTPVCIGVKVTEKSVTLSSIILSIVCTPDRCGDNQTSPVSTCVLHGGVYKGCKVGAGDVTFSDLDPFTQYTVTVYRTGQPWQLLQTLYITTAESERCKKPSISNLQKISPSWEYYNLYDEVTLQCEPGYYPSSDTIRCTNNGVRDDWSPTPVCIDVTGTSNSTRSSIVSLDLVSMLSLIVPIFTVKLLVLVVLLKIQFTLISRKTSETDLVRHEEHKEYRILYRKREEEFLSMQNGH